MLLRRCLRWLVFCVRGVGLHYYGLIKPYVMLAVRGFLIDNLDGRRIQREVQGSQICT